MRQHLTAVEAAAAISGAELGGAEIGSTALTFRPGAVKPGEYAFSVGTAGSTTLVLQTVLPALITAAGPSTLVLEGGTHNPMSPPFDFLAKTYLPVLARMGPRVEAALERPGFYPAGGGRIRVVIHPSRKLEPIAIERRGEIRALRVRAVLANLPRSIGEREIEALRRRPSFATAALNIESRDDSAGPGNVLVAEVEAEALTEVFTSFGEKQLRAEAVAERLARETEDFLGADVPVGSHLADQFVLLLALAGGGSFRTLEPSGHSRTQLAVIERFLERRMAFVAEDGVWRCSDSGGR
jgi:RNA 3'-terminal phosphate cyclase (ATP)